MADREIRTVIHITREYGNLAGAGGIKDVVEGLARASCAAGIDTHVFLPNYRIIQETHDLDVVESHRFDLSMNYPLLRRTETAAVMTAGLGEKLTLHLVDSDRYKYLFEGYGIERRGIYQYTEAEAEALGRPDVRGKGYFDFFALNVLLVKAALAAMGSFQEKPDLIHCHDGHAALLPVLAQSSHDRFDPGLAHVPTVLTIHNAGTGYHQELEQLNFAADLTGLPWEVITGCLLAGKFDPLLAGAIHAHRVNTVSENYARELQHTGQDAATGWLGHTLAGLGVDIAGITNGVDPDSFDPRHPERFGLAADFCPLRGEMDGKEVCKRDLLDGLAQGKVPAGLSLAGTISYQPDTPLITFIGRLHDQKGVDILADAVEELLGHEEDIQLLCLGSGEPELEARFRALAHSFWGRAAAVFGYDTRLAWKVYAAGDFFLIPSRYEPCGLTDYYAQLAGNLPIVNSVGGLVKTVDGRFGFSYLGGPRELSQAVRRALTVYHQDGKQTLRTIQTDAVANIHGNFTWDRVFQDKYSVLYQEAAERIKPALPYR